MPWLNVTDGFNSMNEFIYFFLFVLAEDRSFEHTVGVIAANAANA